MFSLTLEDIIKMVKFFSDILLGTTFGHFVRNVMLPISCGSKPSEFSKIDIILEKNKLHKVRESFGSYLEKGDYCKVEEYEKHVFKLRYIHDVILIIHITDKIPKTIFKEDIIAYHDEEIIDNGMSSNIFNRKLTLTEYYQDKLNCKSIDFVREEGWNIFMYDIELIRLINRHNNIMYTISVLQNKIST